MLEVDTPANPGLRSYSGAFLPGLYFLIVLAVFHETTFSMVRVWIDGETFAHGFLILPISLWLVWRDRDVLNNQAVEPALWVTLLTLFGVPVWLLGWLVDVNVVQQLAMVWIAVTGVWALIGTAVAKRILFPLCFLFLAVPMGEGLIAPLMELTADSTEYLVRMSGIPVYREGMYLTLPTGLWSVVEACSGVRYLIASFTLGLLYAHLSYRSLGRKAIFVAFAILMPIVANSLRAYGIVMIGHLSGMELATGVDHLIYGWVFFGVVMLLLFWGGSFWQQPEVTVSRGGDVANASPSWASVRRSSIFTFMLLLMVVFVAPVLTSFYSRTDVERVHAIEALEPASGWEYYNGSLWDWLPNQQGADRVSHQYYVGESVVMISLYQYLNQVPGAELVSSGEAWRVDRKAWRLVREAETEAKIGKKDVLVDEAELSSASADERLLVWTWYQIGGEYTANPYLVKLLEAKQVLFTGGRVGSRVFLATQLDDDLDVARQHLENFAERHATAIEGVLDAR